MSFFDDEILTGGSDEDLFRYMYDHDRNIVVDWRGEDDEIVAEIAEKTGEPVSAEYTDDGLKIRFEGAEYDLSYELFSPLEKARYVTIRKVQELLRDKYEIRVWRESMLSDTHSLYIKPREWWATMDEKFSERVERLFVEIDENTKFG
ncbi:MAG: hypothetical protein JSS81_00525 [Acidobacteria bacterium]|nr:hypothetical protein [Acidobacteriota bacterium]